jgi:glutathione synthase/RimK-type ligase-like ATP-grasp enzyme
VTTIITYAKNGYGSVPDISERMKLKHQVMRVRRGGETEPCDLLIRWASRVRWPDRVGKTINKSAAIGLASDKAGARLRLQNGNVPVPATTIIHSDIVGPGPMPWVVRPGIHQGGREFYLVDSVEELARVPYTSGWYVSTFYPKQNEYRVHVAHGRVLLVNEKVPREGQEHKREEPVWNHHLNDFEFVVLPWRNLPVEVMRVAIQATEVLGLDYAGVDVMANAPDGPPAVVCEVNCSPTLENYAATQYAVYFDWLAEAGGQQEHFPVPEREAHPQSYIFRQEVGRI